MSTSETDHMRRTRYALEGACVAFAKIGILGPPLAARGIRGIARELGLAIDVNATEVISDQRIYIHFARENAGHYVVNPNGMFDGDYVCTGVFPEPLEAA